MCLILRLLRTPVLLIAIFAITLADGDDTFGASEVSSTGTGTSNSKVGTVSSSPPSVVEDITSTTTTPKDVVENHQYKKVDTPFSSTDILASFFEHMKRDHPVTKFHSALDQAFHRRKVLTTSQPQQQGEDSPKANVDVHENEEYADGEYDEGHLIKRLLRKNNGSKSKSPKHPKKMKYPNSSSKPERDVEVEGLEQCMATLDDTLEKLNECNEAMNATVYLLVQMGDQCTIHRDGKKYKLVVKKMKSTSWQFSDRPRRIEKEISTKDFIDSFDSTFAESWPNAAVTFHTTQDVASDAPLVSIFLDAAHEDDNLFDDFLSVTYWLDQREDQVGIVSLESFFHDGQDHADFEDCSVFIDGFDDLCFDGDCKICISGGPQVCTPCSCSDTEQECETKKKENECSEKCKKAVLECCEEYAASCFTNFCRVNGLIGSCYCLEEDAPQGCYVFF